MGCFCDLVSGFGVRPNCMQMYRSSAHNCSVRPQRVPFCADLLHQWRAGCKSVFVLLQSMAYIFGKYIVLSERLWPSFFLIEVWFRQSYLQRDFVGNWTFELSHETNEPYVTLQTNFRQAPTKRPATTAAGPKTKKAKVAKARVVPPETPVASNGRRWLKVILCDHVFCLFVFFSHFFFCRV